MKISVINMKGGVGKTILSQTIAQHPKIDANIFTNDHYSFLKKLYPEDVIVSNTSKLEKILDDYEDIVFDFGGFIDPKMIHILKLSDLIVVPITSHADTLEASRMMINELREHHIKKSKILIVDNMHTSDSIVEDYMKIKMKGTYSVVSFRASKLFENAKAKKAYIHSFANLNKSNKYVYRNVIEDIEVLIQTILKKVKG